MAEERGESSRMGGDDWPSRDLKPQEWWGDIHAPPEPGEIDRLHMFARPAVMSEEEQESIKARWAASIAGDDGNGDSLETRGLSLHLRPSTPRGERAEKQIRRLEGMMQQQQQTISDAARNRMRGHYAANSGLVESLRHYLEGETHVPVDHVNELLRMNSRLLMETARQLDTMESRHRAEKAELRGEMEKLTERLAAAEKDKSEK